MIAVRAPGHVPVTHAVSVEWKRQTAVDFRLAVEKGQILVNTDPRGVVVKVDGQPRGLSPVSVQAAPGTHEVRLEMGGFKAVTRKVSLRPGRDAVVSATMQPVAVAMAPVAAVRPAAPTVVDVPTKSPAVGPSVRTPREGGRRLGATGPLQGKRMGPAAEGDEVPAELREVRDQMLMALDMVYQDPSRKGFVMRKMDEKLRRAKVVNVPARLFQIATILDRAKNLTAQEYARHRMRLSARMAVIVAAR
jgi:hypothetical protein